MIQFFLKFHDFFMHRTFFSDFPGFPRFPELVGTLYIGFYMKKHEKIFLSETIRPRALIFGM